MNHYRKFSTALLLPLLIGCSLTGNDPNKALIDRLENQGVVALSPDNPYLASNLLISREMSASPELKGFLEHRGPPSAMSLDVPMFGGTEMRLFYMDTREYFEFARDENLGVIRGPFEIAPDDFQDLVKATRGMQQSPRSAMPEVALQEIPVEEPVKPVEKAPKKKPVEKPDPFIEKLEQASFKSPAVPSETPTALPTAAKIAPPKSLPTPSLSALSLSAQGSTPTAPEHKVRVIPPNNAAESAAPIVTSSSGSELNSRGDIAHKVSFPGETLSILARWYTGDLNNAPRLARINNLKDPNNLSLGDTLIIPKYLLKNSAVLTEKDFAKLKAGISAP